MVFRLKEYARVLLKITTKKIFRDATVAQHTVKIKFYLMSVYSSNKKNYHSFQTTGRYSDENLTALPDF